MVLQCVADCGVRVIEKLKKAGKAAIAAIARYAQHFVCRQFLTVIEYHRGLGPLHCCQATRSTNRDLPPAVFKEHTV